MKLNIQKPLVIFDLETTGLDFCKDRVIQLSYIKVMPDGEEKRVNLTINPLIPIPQFITELTGISDADVADKPSFKELAPQLAEEFKGCDLAGYNSNNFDIPMLCEEFLRAGIDFDFSKSRMIDAMAIFRKQERRNLAAAYKFYCGRKMEEDFEAHRADQDTEATYEPEAERRLVNDMQFLADFSKQNDNVDFAGRIVWAEKKDAQGNVVKDKDGNAVKVEVFNFGKYKGQEVAIVLHNDPGYYSWMLQNDFTNNTKQVLTRIRLRESRMM